MKRSIIIFAFLALLSVTPFLAHGADSGLIFCNTGAPNANGKFANECNFASLIELVKRIINFVVKFATLLASLGFIYAGFLLIMDQGSEKNVQKAKNIMTNIAIGFAYILGAWIIVYTIISVLVKPDPNLILLSK